MKDVILVESPTKAKTLTRFLAGKYEVIASMGHVRDLPKSKLGVEIDKDFEPQYIVPRDKQKKVKELKEKVKKARLILLATDPDREGEAISYHLQYLLKDINKKADFQRIVFHEITKGAIEEALNHKRKIDQNLVNAQTARRVLDRIVGYKLSPILWKKVKRHLSAGRVQSVALRLIVERESEITSFNSKSYFRIFLIVGKDNYKGTIDFELTKIDNTKLESSTELKLYDGTYKYNHTNLTYDEAQEILKSIDKKDLLVTDVDQKETKRSPYPPFITSTLQQALFRRHGYSGKKTMSLAQRLYEEGFITYHRTDSYNLSNDFIKKARDFILKEFGKEYLSSEERRFKTKAKGAQEAHEAIRPVGLTNEKDKIKSELGNDFANVYDLIFKRAVATQMSEAIFASTKITGEITNKKTYTFEASGSVINFPGFMKLYSIKEEKTQSLPKIIVGETLKYSSARISEHITTPPARYNEASLISSLEKHGIGRPSTYAPIISTLFDRLYVEKSDGRLTPTDIGIKVNDFLVKNFSNIDDIPFTARLEKELDEIAEGNLKWNDVIKKFYTPFEKQLKKAENAEGVKIEVEYSNKICPKDNGRLIVRQSRYGKFLACENFPECRFTESLLETLDTPCPKDNGAIVMKKTRKGRTFFGCSNYPNCNFAVWKKEDIGKEQTQKTAN